jgi:hypothetical protein
VRLLTHPLIPLWVQQCHGPSDALPDWIKEAEASDSSISLQWHWGDADRVDILRVYDQDPGLQDLSASTVCINCPPWWFPVRERIVCTLRWWVCWGLHGPLIGTIACLFFWIACVAVPTLHAACRASNWAVPPPWCPVISARSTTVTLFGSLG